MRCPKATAVLVLAVLLVSSVASARNTVSFESHEDVAADLRKIDPDLVTQYETGTHHLVQGRYREAVQWFERVLDAAPGCDMALRRCGRARFELGDRREGIRLIALARGIKHRPGTAYWLALARWRCHRDGLDCADSQDVQTIVPLALEAAAAYPLSGNAQQLAIAVMCEFGSSEDRSRFLARWRASLDSSRTNRKIRTMRDVGFPALGDKGRACFHDALAEALGAAESDPTDDRLAGLVELLAGLPETDGSPDTARADMFVLERRFEFDPQTTSLMIGQKIKSMTASTDDSKIKSRGLQLLVESEKVRPGDGELLRSILDLATEIGDTDTLKRLVERIDELVADESDNKALLLIKARAASEIPDWMTVARVARRMRELDPDATRPNVAEDMLGMYPGSSVKIALIKMWVAGEGSWSYRIGGALAGLLAALLFLFGLNRVLVASLGRDVVAPVAAPPPETGDETPELMPGLPSLAQPDQPRWPGIGAALEVVFATLLVSAGTVILTLGVLTGPLRRQVPGPAVIAVMLMLYAVCVFGVGLLLRYTRCRSVTVRGSRESHLVAGVVFGVIVAAAAVVAGIVQSLFGAAPTEQQWIVDLLRQAGASFVVLQLLGTLAIPIAEEMFFRGYVFERLRQGGGLVLAYLLSSVLFAVVHLNPAGLILYLVQGIVLARAYHHRNSILTAAVAHLVNNVAVFGLMMIAQ
jgi:membrane protease YdiL (CAAX protease family)